MFGRIDSQVNKVRQAMNFDLIISEKVEKDLAKIPVKEIKKKLEKIKSLSFDPYPPGNVKIVSSDENLYLVRQGNYRIVYIVREQIKVVELRKVGHRKDIYKTL